MTTGLSALESLCEPRVNPPVGQAIRQAFGAAAPMYDDHAILQRDTLPTLMECLTTVINPTGLTTLLDVGTGTGAAAMAVAEVLHELEGPDAMASKVVYLNDCSDAMLAKAEQKLHNSYPNLTLHRVASEAERLRFPAGGVDAITAHWVLQWIVDWQAALNHWWQHTQCLAFTVPLHDSFDEWRNACDAVGVPFTLNANHYPSLAEITRYCESLQPKECVIKEAMVTQHFASGHAFLRSLKNIGAHTSLSGVSSVSLRKVLRATQNGFSVSTHVAWVALSRRPKNVTVGDSL